MEKEAVLFEVENAVAQITLNQPEKMNALSNEIIEGFKSSINKVKKDPKIRSVIITGRDKAFSAGGDIKSFPSATTAITREYVQAVQTVVTELVHLEKPVIAAVNGFAVGAGFSIAIACDLVIASENAKFSMAFNKVGLIPDLGALYHLPRIVGQQRAKELCFSGRMLSAQEALDYDLVLQVVSDEDLLAEARKLAELLSQGPTIALGLSKSILNRSSELSFTQFLQEEAMAQAIVFTTEDYREGKQAFNETTATIKKNKTKRIC